jgi:hypothetical protein
MYTTQRNLNDRKRGYAEAQPPNGQVDPLRRMGMIAGGLAILFGSVPVWLAVRSLNPRPSSDRMQMRPIDLRNDLATAAMMASRGEYEAARRSAINFFALLRAESRLPNDPYAGAYRREPIERILEQRDQIIRSLGSKDRASARRLVDLYYDLVHASA